MPIHDDAEVAIIPLSQIIFGDRRREDYGNLTDLAQSIKEKGLISSLTVKRISPETYLLLAGGRRYKACENINLQNVPVRIYSRDLSELEIRGIELAENIDRKELSWQEKARLCKEIDDLQRAIHGSSGSGGASGSGWKHADTADLIGVSRPKVQQDIKIAEAIQMFPELANCKTKDEAVKRLKSLGNSIQKEIISSKLMQGAKATPEDKARADLVNSYILQDFFLGVKGIPDETIDFIEIDTPYAIDLKGNKASADGLNMQSVDYNEWDASQYLYKVDELLKESYRVMKREGWLVFWFAQEPWFEPLYQLIVRNGFQCRRIPCIWTKGKDEESAGSGQTMQPDIYLPNTYEAFFYARKGPASICMQGRSNNFPYKPVHSSSKIHPTERPIEMIEDILNTFCPAGGRVMVPFTGSGNTLLAAHNTYRPVFGYDLGKEYKDAFTIRVFEGSLYKYRSYKEV
jgi:DNA modification methylase